MRKIRGDAEREIRGLGSLSVGTWRTLEPLSVERTVSIKEFVCSHIFFG